MSVDHPPRAPRSLPLIGHALPLLRSPLSFFTSLSASGDVVRVRLGPWQAYVVCDPQLTHQVLLDDRTFDKGGPLINRAQEALGTGVGTCPHAEHRRQRRLSQPAFHARHLPAYAAAMTRRIGAVTTSWSAGQTVEVLPAMEEMAVRILIDTLFSRATLSEAEQTRMLHDVVDISRGVFRRMMMPSALARLPLPGNQRFIRAHTRLRDTAARTITRYRQSDADHGDLLSALVAARDPDESGEPARLSEGELTDNVVTYFFAGAETTASLISWALHLTAGHPEVLRQLHAEVDRVLEGGLASYDDLPQLEMTGRIITETLRLRPPGWIFTRVVTRDTTLGGYRIPAGSTVIYSQYLVHHHPGAHPDPERFDPGRWSQGHTNTPAVLIPFAAGARKCIGDTFATSEATLALATIAARWDMRPEPGTRVRPVPGLALRPEGLRMIPTPRKP